MTWTHLESTAFSAIGYDTATQRLQIRFNDGSAYEYRDVPAQVHAALIQADSKGRHFNLMIRAKFAYERLVDS
jgi:hypothetical protein